MVAVSLFSSLFRRFRYETLVLFIMATIMPTFSYTRTARQPLFDPWVTISRVLSTLKTVLDVFSVESLGVVSYTMVVDVVSVSIRHMVRNCVCFSIRLSGGLRKHSVSTPVFRRTSLVRAKVSASIRY